MGTAILYAKCSLVVYLNRTKIILGSNITCWEGAVRSSVILLKALGAPVGIHSETSCTASAKSWVEPGRGFVSAVVGLDLASFPGPCAGEEKEGVGPCFCSSVSTQSILRKHMFVYVALHYINAGFCL